MMSGTENFRERSAPVPLPFRMRSANILMRWDKTQRQPKNVARQKTMFGRERPPFSRLFARQFRRGSLPATCEFCCFAALRVGWRFPPSLLGSFRERRAKQNAPDLRDLPRKQNRLAAAAQEGREKKIRKSERVAQLAVDTQPQNQCKVRTPISKYPASR